MIIYGIVIRVMDATYRKKIEPGEIMKQIFTFFKVNWKTIAMVLLVLYLGVEVIMLRVELSSIARSTRNIEYDIGKMERSSGRSTPSRTSSGRRY